MSEYLIARDDGVGLSHYGIKGQKWGIRRYENEDGTLTPEGKIRYKEAERKANKYKSAGNRIAKSVAGGVVGAGLLGGWGLVGLSLGASVTIPGAAFAQFALAGALGTSLIQGLHAAKVRRGMNFVNEHERAYKKTMKQEYESA